MSRLNRWAVSCESGGFEMIETTTTENPKEERIMKARIPGWETENRIAVAHGFTCRKDAHRGYGWCRFVKDSITVWRVRGGWHRKIDGSDSLVITHHKELEDALQGIHGNVFKNVLLARSQGLDGLQRRSQVVLPAGTFEEEHT
jgi:hypothetical protein